ncbi:MAG: TlpA family protein disulfide reductase [Acidimicrobiales bacterium]|nr:TlpA family protein disulfide reductase [Acidimicrobiales bacterium]
MSNRPNTRKSASARFASTGPREARGNSQGAIHKAWIIVAVASRAVRIVVAVAAAVVVAFVSAVVATSSDNNGGTVASGATVVPAGDLTRGSVQVGGQELAPFTGTNPDPAVGLPAPRLEGQQFDSSSLRFPVEGQPAVLVFLAHWCPHCQKEVPLLAKWLNETGLPNDVGLYAVATSNDRGRPNFPPSDWLRREKWPVPTIVDDAEGSAATAYGLSGFPYFVAVSADGKVVQRTSGELTVDQFQTLLDTARRGQSEQGAANPGPASSR